MAEGKEDKIRGGGSAKKIMGGYAGESKEYKMQGNIWVGEGMPERVKKTKCGGGGCCEKKLRGGGVCRRR